MKKEGYQANPDLPEDEFGCVASVNECLVDGNCVHGTCTDYEPGVDHYCQEVVEPCGDVSTPWQNCPTTDCPATCGDLVQMVEGGCGWNDSIQYGTTFGWNEYCVECAKGAESSLPECWWIGDSCTVEEGYSCICDEALWDTGPQWKGKKCDQDVNECTQTYWNGSMQVDACNIMSGQICTNTAGSYTCDCPEGTTVDGSSCLDIDECAAAPSPCGSNATCENKWTSFDCSCNAGYVLDPDLPEGEFGCVKPPVGACNLTDAYGYCMSYIGTFYTEDWVEQVCAQGVVQGSCPTGDLVIKCRENVGTDPDLEVLMYYYTSMYAVEGLGVANEQDAIDNCEAKGGTVE